MSFLRPEARAFLSRWAEVASAGAVLALALSLALRGGWVLLVIGGVFAAISAQWLWIAIRRMRFSRPLAAPGYVEIDEGVIRYLAPRGAAMGGQVALRDISAIRLISVASGRLWQVKDRNGQMLLIPVGAKGAGLLHDAFATLPDLDMGAAIRALNGPSRGITRLWERR